MGPQVLNSQLTHGQLVDEFGELDRLVTDFAPKDRL